MSNWTPPPGYGQPYVYGGYTYITPPPPDTPQQKEKKQLRKDANFIGIMMLALTAGIQLTFTVIVLILCFAGVLQFSDLYSDTLGMDNTAYLVMYALVYTIAMGFPTVLVALICRRRQFPLSPAKSVSAGVGFLGVLAAMGVCMLANVVANVVTMFFEQFGVESPVFPDLLENTPTSLVLNIIVMAVLPALLEEMVFRGYVMQALRPYGDWFAVLVSAVLFGLMHGNIQQIPFAFCVGVALGWLLIYTNNIWLAVAVHFCNNALSVLLDYMGSTLDAQTEGLFYLIIMAAVGLIGLVALGIMFAAYRYMFSRLESRSLLTPGQRVGQLCAAPAFVISVVVFVLLTVVDML